MDLVTPLIVFVVLFTLLAFWKYTVIRGYLISEANTLKTIQNAYSSKKYHKQVRVWCSE